LKSVTLIGLLVVVVGLGWYAMRTVDQEKKTLADADVRLFPGLDENLVTSVRIENVARDLHMRFERDAGGVWTLSDPVEAPVEPGTIDLVVQAAARARGRALDAAEVENPALLGLDPPRFVLEILEGDLPRRRAEIGAAELDGERVFARVGDKFLRVSRELEPLLDRELHEFRSSSISDVDPRHVVELRRRGAVSLDGTSPASDASFDAVFVDGAWRATAPVTGLLDPAGIALYVQSCATYRFERIFDEGARSLSSLGLDPPELRIELGTTGTEVVEILLGRPNPEGSWLGTRTGSRIVWPIVQHDVGFLATPIRDLLDHKILRARRSGVTHLELDTPTAQMLFVRGARGWTCMTARAGSTVFGLELAAETRAVEDVLGALERYELTGFLDGRTFDPGAAPIRWRVQSESGSAGGRFGAAYVDASGASGTTFQRDGETAVGLGDPGILAVLTRDPALFLSLRLLESNEVDLRAIRLRRGELERRYERNTRGLWTRTGGEVEARDLLAVLDGLLFLRASQRIPEDGRAVLTDVIDVEFATYEGEIRRVAIGIATVGTESRVEIEVDGGRGIAQDQKLHEKLSSLIAGN